MAPLDNRIDSVTDQSSEHPTEVELEPSVMEVNEKEVFTTMLVGILAEADARKRLDVADKDMAHSQLDKRLVTEACVNAEAKGQRNTYDASPSR